MKNLVLILAFVVGTLSVFASSKNSFDLLSYDDTVVVTLKDTFNVELVSNPSTGYKWNYETDKKNKKIKLVDDKFEAPNTEMVGVAGKRIYTFCALKKGEFKLVFNYARGTQTPEKTHTILLIVNKKCKEQK